MPAISQQTGSFVDCLDLLRQLSEKLTEAMERMYYKATQTPSSRRSSIRLTRNLKAASGNLPRNP